jgi:hypothetical protein
MGFPGVVVNRNINGVQLDAVVVPSAVTGEVKAKYVKYASAEYLRRAKEILPEEEYSSVRDLVVTGHTIFWTATASAPLLTLAYGGPGQRAFLRLLFKPGTEEGGLEDAELDALLASPSGQLQLIEVMKAVLSEAIPEMTEFFYPKAESPTNTD